MPLTSTAELILAAWSEGTGVGAFNVTTLEHAEAVASCAASAGHGTILARALADAPRLDALTASRPAVSQRGS